MAIFRSTFALSDNQHPRNRPEATGKEVLQGRGANGLTELTTTVTSGLVQDGGSDFAAPQDGYVTMHASAAMWVKIAAAPTAAVASDFYMEALERLELAVQEGDKIAVIDDS